MKKIFILFFSVILISIEAQNVAINATGAAPNTSAGLDIDFTNKGFLPPRIALTGTTDAATIPTPATGLMVYNTNTAGGLTPGYYYNRGTAASPYWAPFSKQLIYHSAATAGVSLITNGVVTLIPGTAITVVVPAGLTADIDIFAYCGASINGGSLSTDNAVADLIIYRNGSFLPTGGWNRVKLYNNGGGTTDQTSTSINSRDSGIGAGTYTYDLRGNRFSGTFGITVGGNCATQVNCGEMTIMVTFR
jgi:hypothetical protein